MTDKPSDPEFDAEAYAVQAATALSIPLDPAHLPGVTLNLRRSAGLAALLLHFDLDEEAQDPAPVSRP